MGEDHFLDEEVRDGLDEMFDYDSDGYLDDYEQFEQFEFLEEPEENGSRQGAYDASPSGGGGGEDPMVYARGLFALLLGIAAFAVPILFFMFLDYLCGL